jgi:hypothetical protein
MKNNERVAHWLEAARIAADALEHCIAEAQRALREEAAPEEVAETPTAPLRPHPKSSGFPAEAVEAAPVTNS